MRTRTTATTASDERAGSNVRLRPYRGKSDHPAMVDLNNAARSAAGFVERVQLEQLDIDYAHLTNCDPDRDIRLAEVTGVVAGYGRVFWADRTSGERCFETICHVAPEVRGRGVGGALLNWQLDRITEIAAATAEEIGDRPAVIAGYRYGTDEHARRLVEAHGFTDARLHAEMVRPNLADIPEVPMPDGLVVRPIDPTDKPMLRRSFEADREAFQDHWGDIDGSETAWQRFLVSPEIQPALWQVAFDEANGEIAGQILNYLEEGQDGRMVGWTESISVQRPYRRRGLARALLARSLVTVRDAGAVRAALGVDTQNVNEALTLYESLGFGVVANMLEYHRPVRLEAAR